MQDIKELYSVAFPQSTETPIDFKFSTVHPEGVFQFRFRFFQNRWNGWCTLPSGEIRAFGIEPNVISWTGFVDFGLVFITDLPEISRNNLFLTKLFLISWESPK